jgi:hypothetical protein
MTEPFLKYMLCVNMHCEAGRKPVKDAGLLFSLGSMQKVPNVKNNGICKA